MDIRTALVKVYLKLDNIFRPVSAGTLVIDILCLIFDFLATMQMAVAGLSPNCRSGLRKLFRVSGHGCR